MIRLYQPAAALSFPMTLCPAYVIGRLTPVSMTAAPMDRG